jgi:outer membrane protein
VIGYPTIDAFASRSRNWNSGGYPYGTTKNQGGRDFSDAIGVEINIPIYQGGFRSSQGYVKVSYLNSNYKKMKNI